MVAGAELCGVHVLLGRAEPGSYHIGGGGLLREEPIVRALGESAERYSQFVAHFALEQDMRFASAAAMARDGQRTVDLEPFFTAEQHAEPGFLFTPFDPEAPLNWLPASTPGGRVWAPAQLLLVGYHVRHEDGEPWLASAVTTGTAVHGATVPALRNALLELIQVDAAIGHWYSGRHAPRIVLGPRVDTVRRILDRRLPRTGLHARFHWLSSADLPALNVACVLRVPEGRPAAAIGLGSDRTLAAAMYKAFLEATGVMQLAKLTLLGRDGDGEPAAYLDLDSNVAHYSEPDHAPVLDRRFPPDAAIAAEDLPPDDAGAPDAQVAAMIGAFRARGMELLGLDLTTHDIAALGLRSVRVWSPDVLSLCLPGVPPLAHPRFAAYGGAEHRDPHPYP
jgi:thiazole/oxazole-forming peptide maturase SagD family component